MSHSRSLEMSVRNAPGGEIMYKSVMPERQ